MPSTDSVTVKKKGRVGAVSNGVSETNMSEDYLAYGTPTTSTAPWELVVTSTKLKQWTWAGVVVIMAIHIFMALVVRLGYTGAAVTTVDQWSFIGIGIIFSGIWMLGLRPRVRVNKDGVEVRNFLNPQFYPWEIVHGLSFPKNSRTARLELPDFEFVSMWAFQAADGNRVVDAVNSFRLLEDAYLPED